MPSSPSHAVVAASVYAALLPRQQSLAKWAAAGAVIGVLPDLDSLVLLGPELGVLMGGHRGVTHSIPFALIAGGTIGWLFTVMTNQQTNDGRLRTVLACQLALMSHGLIDCFTAYGPSVALWAPFSWDRVTAIWHPLDPSLAISEANSVIGKTAAGLWNEVVWLWIPSIVFLVIRLAVGFLTRIQLKARSATA